MADLDQTSTERVIRIYIVWELEVLKYNMVTNEHKYHIVMYKNAQNAIFRL